MGLFSFIHGKSMGAIWNVRCKKLQLPPSPTHYCRKPHHVTTKHEICSQTGWWPSTNAPTTVQDPSYNWTVDETKPCSIFSKIQTNNLHDYVWSQACLVTFFLNMYIYEKRGVSDMGAVAQMPKIHMCN